MTFENAQLNQRSLAFGSYRQSTNRFLYNFLLPVLCRLTRYMSYQASFGDRQEGFFDWKI
jgi:hypothetical protein